MEYISRNRSSFFKLPYLEKRDYSTVFNKGWSFFYIYSLQELRDIYLALINWDNESFDLEEFFVYCRKIKLPFKNRRWQKRRILENLNALIDTSIIDNNFGINRYLFCDSSIGSPLSKDDLSTFRDIFFRYFRFKEMFFWFMGSQKFDQYNYKLISKLRSDEIIDNTKPLFYFSNKSRFTDSFFFIIKDNPDIYYFGENDEDLMRFWDVFIKWGVTLNILEKFSLSNINVKFVDNKNINCIFVISNSQLPFDFIDYLNLEFKERYIYIPKLIFKLAIQFRQSISKIKKYLLEQYQLNKNALSFERTSEIFIKKEEIKDEEKLFFLKYNNSYISHIIIRKYLY